MFLIRYCCALLYDGLILLTLFLAFTAFSLMVRRGTIIEPNTPWHQIALLIITYCYYYLSYRSGGQTLGMKAWRIQLVSSASTLSHRQIIGRMCLALPALLYGLMRFKSPQQSLARWTQTKIVPTIPQRP